MLFLKKHQEQLISKMKHMEDTYTELIFEKICTLPSKLLTCKEHYRNVPKGEFVDILTGDSWGGEDITGWFKCEYVVPDEMEGKKLFISAKVGAPESMLFINGNPRGIYATKHGNHHTLMLCDRAKAEDKINIDIESYCWFNYAGCFSFDKFETNSREAIFNGIHVSIMNEPIKDFVFNLRAVNQLVKACKEEYRLSELVECLENVSKVVYQKPQEHPNEKALEKLLEGNKFLLAVLSRKGSASRGYVGLVGHSHMDTAWIWPMDETIRKCARTYANALSLMEQYPEYTFIQSSAYHSALMKRHYPSIWEGMKKQIAAGRYEPNGGVWIECDCNIPSGESIIRQFLWGQKFYEKNCNYRADTFWLPDTFGYSAALPQILLGCGIKYFTTTKLSWNDTNEFPYETFLWRGNDGSEVITHFNITHCEPGLDILIKATRDGTKHKRSFDGRLVSYGIGDGGGGPSYDSIEITRRAADVEGCPKSEYTSVTKFMDQIAENKDKLPLYSGELYLEIHRGTLTSIHEIKRNNRLAEFKLRSLEMLYSFLGKDNKEIDDLYEITLINQFHDILPGTSIPVVNDTTISQMQYVLKTAGDRIENALQELSGRGEFMTIFNPLSWENGGFYIDDKGLQPKQAHCQCIKNIFGESRIYVENIQLKALAMQSFEMEKLNNPLKSNFEYKGNVLETPVYIVVFDNKMAIESLVLKSSHRELVRKDAININTFLISEDVPLVWDNWDIEYEAIVNLKPDYELISTEIAADGALQFRLRNTFKIGDNSTIKQDMVFYAGKEQIDFETLIDWNEKHTLLKAGFDFDILTDYAKHEIQFGFIERPTFKRNSFEQAMFEVSNHKYTDISETNFGVAILNDCKYGISIEGTKIGLSLMKSGTHPDTRGDKGIHRVTYSILPHGAFNTKNVISPAYALNTQVLAAYNTSNCQAQLLEVEKENIVVEAIKPAWDGNGIIVRLYECEKTAISSMINIFAAKKVFLANMLEENIEELDIHLPLNFKAFEIKTLRVIV